MVPKIFGHDMRFHFAPILFRVLRTVVSCFFPALYFQRSIEPMLPRIWRLCTRLLHAIYSAYAIILAHECNVLWGKQLSLHTLFRHTVWKNANHFQRTHFPQESAASLSERAATPWQECSKDLAFNESFKIYSIHTDKKQSVTFQIQSFDIQLSFQKSLLPYAVDIVSRQSSFFPWEDAAYCIDIISQHIMRIGKSVPLACKRVSHRCVQKNG